MNLIVGATGVLGGEICRLLAEKGKPVRALVRVTSDPAKVERLRRMGAEIVQGDLKDRPSLDAACRGVSAIVSTAASVHSRQEGDSFDTVDRQGHVSLIDAAEAAGVQHFVHIAFPHIAVDFPLQAAKRAVEERLRRGRLTYTVLQPTFFMEVWLSPALGFDVAGATARIYGSGRNGISWISFLDVAKLAVASLDNPRAANAVLELGGPAALSPLDVVRLAEEMTGKAFEVQHVPEEGLRAQHAGTTDPMQRTFTGLMLYYASGDVIDMTETLKVLPVPALKTVQEYLRTTT